MSAATTSTGYFSATTKSVFRSKATDRNGFGRARPATNSRSKSTSGSPHAKRVSPVGYDDRITHGKQLIKACFQRWTESTGVAKGSHVYEAIGAGNRRDSGTRYVDRRTSPHQALEEQLPAEVIEDYGRQVLHFLRGDVESDAVLERGHGTDRDRHFFAAQDMPLLEENVGHVMIARIDDEPLDSSDFAVGGMDSLASVHGHLAQREGVIGDGLCDVLRNEAVVGPRESLARTVGRIAHTPRHELCLLAQLELLERRQLAAQLDLAIQIGRAHV